MKLQDLLTKLQHIIFLACIFFLPTQLGKHFWPSFSIVSGARVDYLSPTVYFTDILIVLLIGSWLIEKNILSNRHSGKPRTIQSPTSRVPTGTRQRLSQNPTRVDPGLCQAFGSEAQARRDDGPALNLNYKLLFFLVVLIVGVFLSKQPLAGLYGLLKLVEFGLFGYITSRLLRDKKLFSQAIIVFASSMLLQSGLAIAQFFNHGSIGGLLYFLGERTFSSDTPGIANASVNGELVLRPYGALPHPNVLAAYLLLGQLIVFSIFQVPFSIYKKSFLVLIFILSSAAIVLTLSRVAIMCWILLLLYFALNGKWKMRNGKLLLPMLLGITLLLANTIVYQRFVGTNLREEAVVQRQELSFIAIKMIKDHPFFGVGLQNFIVELPSYQIQPHPTLLLQPVHNILLLVAAETGLLGLGLFVWFLWKSISSVLRRPHPTPLLTGEGKLYMLLITILLLGLFDHYFLTLQQGRMLFAFVLGLCWCDFRTLRWEKLAKKG